MSGAGRGLHGSDFLWGLGRYRHVVTPLLLPLPASNAGVRSRVSYHFDTKFVIYSFYFIDPLHTWQFRQAGQHAIEEAIEPRKQAAGYGLIIEIMPAFELINLDIEAGNNM